MNTPVNQRTVTLKLKRIDVANLILATTIVKQNSDSIKWGLLHDKLKAILDDFDAKIPPEAGEGGK